MAKTSVSRPVQRRRSRAEWTELVRALEGSGLSVGRFAAERGLAPNTLAWWRSRLRDQAGTPRAIELVPVRREGPGSAEVVFAGVTVVLHDAAIPEIAALVRALLEPC
jgi:transposase-like protein